MGLRAKVLTGSDGVVAGTRENRSGAALAETLESFGFVVDDQRVVADGNVLIPALRDHGATDIIELPLSKIVH